VVSALGLALVIVGGVASARSGVDAEVGAAVTPSRSAASLSPYEVEPIVRIRADDGPAARPAVHPAKGTPQRIVVPRLGVDAPVVGIDASGGVLLPPDDPQVLGWWRSGAKPGARYGSALVTGHTVSSGGGAFDDLETLRGGDRVSIRTTGGTIAYEVTGVTIYRKASLARHASRVFSQRVPGRLVLITCEDWNGTTYLSNAVVIAQPVS
jgi:LPXTG-site transpeptidase (sortase) family protein